MSDYTHHAVIDAPPRTQSDIDRALNDLRLVDPEADQWYQSLESRDNLEAGYKAILARASQVTTESRVIMNAWHPDRLQARMNADLLAEVRKELRPSRRTPLVILHIYLQRDTQLAAQLKAELRARLAEEPTEH